MADRFPILGSCISPNRGDMKPWDGHGSIWDGDFIGCLVVKSEGEVGLVVSLISY